MNKLAKLSICVGTVLADFGHEYQANLDYCVVYQDRIISIGENFHELSSSYCCKSCCFISITSAKKCTKNYCENICPTDGDFDDHEFYLNGAGDSFGCDNDNEFCHLDESSGTYNKYSCTPKLDTKEYCDHDK